MIVSDSLNEPAGTIWFLEDQVTDDVSPEAHDWAREHMTTWLEDPNQDERLVMLFYMLDVIGVPSDMSNSPSESDRASLSTELDSDTVSEPA